MRNILRYFYQMIIDDDKDINNGYFTYNNHLFCLYQYQRNINEIEGLSFLNQYMINENIQINQIIFNINKEIVTKYENNLYVLLLVNYEYNEGYFKFVYAPNDNKLNLLKRDKWSYLWSVKIDYIEYQIKHLENNYPLLQESVFYYIGMSENAISYFNILNNLQEPLYINHRRIKKDTLYNPMELVIDYKVRDIAEYFKSLFFHQQKSIHELKNMFLKLNLNMMDYLLFYIRMLYPSYYFDLYEEIINNQEDEKKVLKIIELSSLYEELLYELYLVIREKINIIGMEWINKKFIIKD